MRRCLRWLRDAWLIRVVAELFAWHVLDEVTRPDEPA